MSLIWLILYNILVIPLIYIGFWIGSLFNAKIREGLKARKNQFARLIRRDQKGCRPETNSCSLHLSR